MNIIRKLDEAIDNGFTDFDRLNKFRTLLQEVTDKLRAIKLQEFKYQFEPDLILSWEMTKDEFKIFAYFVHPKNGPYHQVLLGSPVFVKLKAMAYLESFIDHCISDTESRYEEQHNE